MTTETVRDNIVAELAKLGEYDQSMHDLMVSAMVEDDVIIFGYAISQTMTSLKDRIDTHIKEVDPDGSKLAAHLESKKIIADSFFDAISRLRN